MRNSTPKRIENVTVESIDVTGAYIVQWGKGATDCMVLFGISRPASDIAVGDKGYLVYKSGPSYGLWLFKKYNEKGKN